MKKLLFLLNMMLVTAFVYAQKEIHYEILRNEPQSHNNLFVSASPVFFDISNNTGVCFGLGASYNHKEKFIVDLDFHRSYTEKTNLLFGSFESYDRNKIGRYGEPMGPMKNLMVFNMSGQYLFNPHIREGRKKVPVVRGYHKTVYIKVPTKRLYAFPLRVGYYYYQLVINSASNFGSTHFSWFGTKINDPAATPEAIQGYTNYKAQILTLGIGIYIRDDIKITVIDSRPQYSGDKEVRESTYYYADILFPMNQKIENMNVIETYYPDIFSSAITIEDEYNMNDHTPKTKMGFRVGRKYLIANPSSWGAAALKVEVGCRPGPIEYKRNLFLVVGFDIIFSKRTY
ncbi:MAG: hypothetical protein RQ866_02660 [Bacteroidales bacterium]|nr:hypothetical protein [Bacteroidales bacterium]